MSKEILIVKNITREGPGLLETILKERGIQYTIVDLDVGEKFPAVEKYGAVVVLGGPDSANDDNEKMKVELAHIREVLNNRIPYLGICLGLQVLVKAGGGQVIKNPIKEIGLIDPEKNNFIVTLTDAGKADPLFEGLNDEFKVFHLHGETVVLTPEMARLGTGKFCENQIVRVGQNAYGLQCHFELTPKMFEVWQNEDPDLLAMDRAGLKKQFEKIQSEYTAVGRSLFQNFLHLAGF